MKRISLVFVLLLALVPAYMYLAFDVALLATEYPHRILRQNDDPEYTIKKERPSDWVSLKEISRFARGAIVLSEDWAFYQHEGVDFDQIRIATEDMWEKKKFRGASTITQQLMKNIYLSHEKSLWRKVHEIVLAQKAEKFLSKERILEIYLNCIEYGPMIYGIKAASRHYFGKHPSGISAREGAFLAMLLPSPKRYYVSFRKKKLTPFARKRIETILVKMRMGKILSPEMFTAELAQKFSWEN